MVNNRSHELFWFCLTLALAISLMCVGSVILVDVALDASELTGILSLRPGGGLVAISVGSALLALLFRRPRTATWLSLLVVLLPLALTAVTHTPGYAAINSAAITSLLVLTLVCIGASLLAALHLARGWLVGLIAAPVVFAIGMLSLISQWHPDFTVSNLGRAAEMTVVSPLVMLISLVLPFLQGVYRRARPVFSSGLIVLGTLGILVTTVSWHILRTNHNADIQQRANALATQMVTAGESALDIKLALIRRLAERWELMNGIPDQAFWQQEVNSYLRDFPDLRLIAILDPHHRPVRVESRTDNYRFWLHRFLNDPRASDWLDHTVATGAPHLSRPLPDHTQRIHAAIAAPVSPQPDASWLVLAVIDLQAMYEKIAQEHADNLEVEIYSDNIKVFDSSPELSSQSEIPLAALSTGSHHTNQWRVMVYMPAGSLSPGELYLPPLVLFTGLGLSFLVMLTHLFWRESERRSRSLEALNDTLNFHLDEERGLRTVNERIMKFSRDLLCSIGADGRILSISPASEAVLGYRPEELQGTDSELLVVAEDRATTAETVHSLAAGNGETAAFRTRLRHKHGHLITVSWTAEWSTEDQALFCVGRDISEELVAEILTQERNQFFALSPDMFCIVDLNSLFFEVNQTFLDTLGYPREQLLGRSYMDLIVPDDRRSVMDAVRLLTEGTDVDDLNVRALDREGKEHWLQINATLSDYDLIYVAARDNTEARLIQEKLRSNEALLKMAEKAARIGAWILDVKTGQTIWSDVIFDIHELPRGRVPHLKEALQFYTPDFRAAIQQAVETCIHQGIPFDEEVQIQTAAGRIRWIRMIGHAVKNHEGTITRLQGALQDVTPSRQASEQIRRFAKRQAAIFESITDAFFTVDRDWRFLHVNRRSEELLEKSREELLGHSLWETFPSALGTKFEHQYRHAMETGESVAFEACYEPLDLWLEVSAYPSDEGLSVYYRSIRERKDAQWKLEATMAKLERSNRELQEFAFVASHDLQEPLRKIQAFSDRLISKSERLDEQEKDYLRRMQSAAGRMQALIQDLLTYSRVTTKARPSVCCDLNQILNEVLQDMETTLSQQQAQVQASPLPPVEGDPIQLRQVLQNLISNGVKFRKPVQNPVVMVYAEDITADGWTLVVSDNGIGFDPCHAGKLFHPFQRLHQRQEYAGTGIGLAIVKKILDRHGAHISAEGEPHAGARFRVRFSRQQTGGLQAHGDT